MEEVVAGLLSIGAHVFACVFGYFLGNVLLGWAKLPTLIFLYVLHFFTLPFAVLGLESVLKFFQIRIKVGEFLLLFLSHLFLAVSLIFLLSFLDFWLSGWKFEALYWGIVGISKATFIYFTLPLGVGFFIMNLIGKALGYSFGPEEKAMAQGSLSEIFSANHEGGKSGKSTVLSFADYAKQLVVGQDHAIETIQKVLIANSKLADMGNLKRQRILASFLFVGPTGVGKTETAKALADWLKNYGYDYLRIDANQFSDRESTWTLLGSPKGYIGSETPGLLPSAISKNPRQVILIDEIEKADQGFYQFLLQMLDEGYVIDRSTGNVYYLQRAIVIITSNLENKRIAEIMETLSNPIEIDIAVRKTLEGAVIRFGGGRSFRITPEFLSRIDEIIPFRSLGFEDLVQIAHRELKGLGVNISYETVYELSQKYYPVAKEYGVRYFLKKIQEDVLTQ